MVATYRYVFADLLTDRNLAVLELEDVRFDRRIIQPGSFEAKASVPNARVAEQVRKAVPSLPAETHTGPGRTVCHVYRSGALWGSYLIWSAIPSKDGRGNISVDFRGASLESYLHHVEIRQDLFYPDTEQLWMAANLLNHMQSTPSSDIGLVVTVPSGTKVRDRTYLRSEAASYGQRLTELAQVDDGFEWMIRTYLDANGARVREFVAAPTLSGTAEDHIWTEPGNVLKWKYGSDATDAATSYQTRGATINTDLGEQSEPLMAEIHDATDLLAAGWPLLTETVDYQNVTQPQTLHDYARWWRDNRSGAVRIPEVTVRLDDNTAFNPNSLGDYARITLVNIWWPLIDGRPSFSQRWRIVGAEITPVDRDSGQEECRLIFEEAA